MELVAAGFVIVVEVFAVDVVAVVVGAGCQYPATTTKKNQHEVSDKSGN